MMSVTERLEKIRQGREDSEARVEELRAQRAKKLQETGKWTYLEWYEGNYQTYDDFVLEGLGLTTERDRYDELDEQFQSRLIPKTAENFHTVEKTPDEWSAQIKQIGAELKALGY
jgi:ribulose kinase